jgi:hypothetical protein
MVAELIQRCLDASWDEPFPLEGRFYKATVKGRGYWYFVPSGLSPQRRYIGSAEDPTIAERVARFQAAKAEAKERRMMVRSLVAAGLPRPAPPVGDIIEALARAGLFRLGGVLLGSAALQGYAGYLGVRLPKVAAGTSGDVAPPLAVSVVIEGDLSLMIEALRAADPTFVPVASLDPYAPCTTVRNQQGLEVAFLALDRAGSGEPPAPGPDFLIRAPVRSVLLHKAGVLVTLPAPERYAVHELIVAARNNDTGRQKARKGLAQAGSLIMALYNKERQLGEVFLEAWDHGPEWREALAVGHARLADEARALLGTAISAACKRLGREMVDLNA